MSHATEATIALATFFHENVQNVMKTLDDELSHLEQNMESMMRAKITVHEWVGSFFDKKEEVRTWAVANGIPPQMFEDMWEIYHKTLKTLNTRFYNSVYHFYGF